MTPPTKTCRICGEPKPLADFYHQKRSTGGVYYNMCRDCMGKRRRKRNSRPLLELVYPRVCRGCQAPLTDHSPLCEACLPRQNEHWTNCEFCQFEEKCLEAVQQGKPIFCELPDRADLERERMYATQTP